eukprot:TRINITY_DN122364_c0_g1_i1.p7 TRINITY_DN122364_c0_g1~~TRINITY_DN122364_c0_g1_i1.p7  ORF type:complete len:149 (-),score=3.28 TRINITY_DN122364_c0_g1_i1:572-1018(-)
MLSAAFKGKAGFALAARNSLEQFGKVIILLAAPAIYNFSGSVVASQWFIFALASVGFAFTLLIGRQDAPELIQKNEMRCRELLKIPPLLLILLITLTCSFTLSMAFAAFLSAYTQQIGGFSNQSAGTFLVISFLCNFKNRVYTRLLCC